MNSSDLIASVSAEVERQLLGVEEVGVVPEDQMKVFEATNFSLANGAVNISDEQVVENIRHSIRLGFPQAKRQPPNGDRVVIVGGGPSLAETEPQIVALVHEGAKLVTLNGAYDWALERNLRPSATIVMDGRASNARFVERQVPHCRYLLASQCHPDVWAMVKGRPNVWIFHAAGPDSAIAKTLDEYYLGNWHGVIGGTTVFTRGLMLLRMLGYLRFDAFGIDSCWLDDKHHAFPQKENDDDARYHVRVESPDGERRVFQCSGWHVKQAEDFLQTIRINGNHFLLNVHGPGLLAYMLRSAGSSVTVTQEA